MTLLADLPDGVTQIAILAATIITLVAATYVRPWLKAKRVAAQAGASGAWVDKLEEFLWHGAEIIVNKEIPRLASMIEAGTLTDKKDIHDELVSYGEILGNQARDFIKKQGYDLDKIVDREQLSQLIRYAADQSSPFPGIPTTEALSNGELRAAFLNAGRNAAMELLHKRVKD